MAVIIGPIRGVPVQMESAAQRGSYGDWVYITKKLPPATWNLKRSTRCWRNSGTPIHSAGQRVTHS